MPAQLVANFYSKLSQKEKILSGAWLRDDAWVIWCPKRGSCPETATHATHHPPAPTLHGALGLQLLGPKPFGFSCQRKFLGSSVVAL